MEPEKRFRHTPNCIFSIDVCRCGADDAKQEWADTQLAKHQSHQDKLA